MNTRSNLLMNASLELRPFLYTAAGSKGGCVLVTFKWTRFNCPPAIHNAWTVESLGTGRCEWLWAFAPCPSKSLPLRFTSYDKNSQKSVRENVNSSV